MNEKAIDLTIWKVLKEKRDNCDADKAREIRRLLLELGTLNLARAEA